MYAIVVFDNEMETEYIPFNWIINKIQFQEVSALVRQRVELKCYWPPWSNFSKVSRAQKLCSEPDTDWNSFRLLAVAGNEKEAWEKVKVAEETSNVEEIFIKQKSMVLEKKLSNNKDDGIESTDSESKYSNSKSYFLLGLAMLEIEAKMDEKNEFRKQHLTQRRTYRMQNYILCSKHVR
nr:uncharacterized protein LOC124816467 [Hydra vulgaris]XP_047141885.1 uncharacterized protein LOC124816467 [Hydra vulgaris]